MFDGSIEEVTGTTMKLSKALKEFEEVKNEDTEHEDIYAEVNGIKNIEDSKTANENKNAMV